MAANPRARSASRAMHGAARATAKFARATTPRAVREETVVAGLTRARAEERAKATIFLLMK
jgi:hypothetical protein